MVYPEEICVYGDGSCWQIRNYLDRRFWMTSGGWPNAIGYGVVDGFGDIVRTDVRPAMKDLWTA